MSAFDEARRGGPKSRPLATKATGAFDSAASGASRGAGAVSSYQGADRLYTSTCDNIEKELKKLATFATTLKKQVDLIGGAKDSPDIRTKVLVLLVRWHRNLS